MMFAFFLLKGRVRNQTGDIHPVLYGETYVFSRLPSPITCKKRSLNISAVFPWFKYASCKTCKPVLKCVQGPSSVTEKKSEQNKQIHPPKQEPEGNYAVCQSAHDGIS